MSTAPRKWTPPKRRRVVQYYEAHGFTPTVNKYRINSNMLKRWRAEFGKPTKSWAEANGHGIPPDAIIYLQNARRNLSREPTKAELLAMLALHELEHGQAKT